MTRNREEKRGCSTEETNPDGTGLSTNGRSRTKTIQHSDTLSSTDIPFGDIPEGVPRVRTHFFSSPSSLAAYLG
jgi:hypothetical protein